MGGQRSRSTLFSGWGGQEGEDDFLACSGEQKVYPREQGVGLFGPWWNLSPQPRLEVFTSSLARGSDTALSPGSFPSQGCVLAASFFGSCRSDPVTASQSLRGSFSQPQNICVTSSLQAWKARGAEAPSVLFVAARGPQAAAPHPGQPPARAEDDGEKEAGQLTLSSLHSLFPLPG